jgi:hypothetical protein
LPSSELFIAGTFSNSTVFLGGSTVAVRRGLWDKDGESVGVGEDVPDVIFVWQCYQTKASKKIDAFQWIIGELAKKFVTGGSETVSHDINLDILNIRDSTFPLRLRSADIFTFANLV